MLTYGTWTGSGWTVFERMGILRTVLYEYFGALDRFIDYKECVPKVACEKYVLLLVALPLCLTIQIKKYIGVSLALVIYLIA